MQIRNKKFVYEKKRFKIPTAKMHQQLTPAYEYMMGKHYAKKIFSEEKRIVKLKPKATGKFSNFITVRTTTTIEIYLT